MPISTNSITAEQRDRLLTISEGHFADIKAIEIAPGKLTKALSAFANADGGDLYVDIHEDRRSSPPTRAWRGFANEEAANGHIQALEALFPLGQDVSYEFLRCDGSPGFVLHALVLKTRDIKRATDGVPYLRRGAQSLPIDTPEKLRRLELDKGVLSFETSTVAGDAVNVTNSTTILRFLIDVIPTAEPEPWLHKQQ